MMILNAGYTWQVKRQEIQQFLTNSLEDFLRNQSLLSVRKSSNERWKRCVSWSLGNTFHPETDELLTDLPFVFFYLRCKSVNGFWFHG